MKMLKTLLSLAITLAIMSINVAMAANYTVGGSNGGWDQSTDLSTWASSQRFLEGDNLIFQFTPNHDVTEVSEADFGPCTTSNPVQPPHTGGVAVIPLTSAGSRYFICGTGGHCLSGMKVQIDTLAASAPPPSTTSSPPPTPSARPPPRTVAPLPSPKHSPTPKISPTPPSKKEANDSTSPPSVARPPIATLLQPPPAPSSAAKFDVMVSLTACSGFALMMMFLNL